ncbi:zinc-binding dehydrogenase [Marinobacter antarcticus]|uniref:zinc-binding dehydrogenase n=1 Tax=Marinobacter antarcticus TaxID=564117 RepID=UPI001E3DF2B1|nr:zinc-binding dehydrogenase [Marinobacter antarcticus]
MGSEGRADHAKDREAVFPNIVRYIEQGEIQPVLAKTFPFSEIAEAQKEFLMKKHVGKFVLIPQPLRYCDRYSE